MEKILELLGEYRVYVVASIIILVGLFALRFLLNRPSQTELDHEKRLEQLKGQSKDRYRETRPLK